MQRDAPTVFWFRLPDNEAGLMNLPPAQLKCYIVVARAIQLDRNAGKISARQVAKRTRLSLRHAHDALSALVKAGWFDCEAKPGATATYALRHRWKGGNCSPVGEQPGEPEPANCIPTGEHHRSPVGERSGPNCPPVGLQNCSPLGKQHLEYSEKNSLSGVVDGLRGREQRERRRAPAEKNPFEEFQERYPEPKRWVKVESACRAYVGRIHGKPGEHQRLMDGLARYKASSDWQRALSDVGGRFIPNMERFITDGMYLDHPPPADETAADGYREFDPEDFRREELAG